MKAQNGKDQKIYLCAMWSNLTWKEGTEFENLSNSKKKLHYDLVVCTKTIKIRYKKVFSVFTNHRIKKMYTILNYTNITKNMKILV